MLRFGALLAPSAALLFLVPVAQSAPREPVTFGRDVAPIIYRNCVPCHRAGELAPFSLLTYEDVRQRAHLIVRAIDSHAMPPWKPESECCDFEGDRRLHDDEIQTLLQWVADGALEGDPADVPPPPVFTPGWQLGPPDLVVRLSTPYAVPAEGTDVFRNFVLPLPIRSRRYVQAVELRPGNGRVVHHARMLIDRSGESRRRDASSDGVGFPGMEATGAQFPDGHFLGWAPGKTVQRDPLSWTLEPGTDLVIQMHLRPTGRSELLQPSVGLYFTDGPPPVEPVLLRLGAETIDIPAGAGEYVVADRYVLPASATVLRVYPHAHYLGRDMSVRAILPDGEVRGLFHIPDWDFNWQDEYVYARPTVLPRGTALEMRYTYDNSSANPRNPNVPPARVRFGPRSTDEMGELLVQLLPSTAADAAMLRADAARKANAIAVAGEEKRIADDPADYEARNALGVHYVQAGRREAARAQFEAALRLSPTLAVAHYNLAVMDMAQGRRDEAAAHFEQAIAARPDYVEAHTNFGVLLAGSGQLRKAADHYHRALEANPDHLAAVYNLARLRLTSTDPALFDPIEAVRLAERADTLAGAQNPAVLDLLAAAYAASGRVDEAVRAAAAALARAEAAHDEALEREIRARLAQYQQLDR